MNREPRLFSQAAHMALDAVVLCAAIYFGLSALAVLA